MIDFTDQVDFHCAEDVKNFFGVYGRYVGPRKGEGKRSDNQKELFNLRQYLSAILNNGLMNFPFGFLKSESPDFIFFFKDEKWGLEITQATTRNYQEELTLEENETRSIALIDGDGWVGDAPERHVCAVVIHALRRKVRKIKSGKYQKFSRFDLLIYIDVEPFFYDDNVAFEMISQFVKKWPNQWNVIHELSIISHDTIFFDMTRNPRILPQNT